MAPTGHLTGPAAGQLLKGTVLNGEWTLDPARTAIGLRARAMWGLLPVSGVFREASGKGTVAADGAVHGVLTIAAASINTKIAKRDEHLRSADFFDTATYPDITFTADGVRPSDQGLTVSGTLTVRGRTRPLSFEAEVTVAGAEEVWLDAEVVVNRADFGLTYTQRGTTKMNNTLTVHAVFTKSQRSLGSQGAVARIHATGRMRP